MAGMVRLCITEPCYHHVEASAEDVCRALRTGGPVAVAEHVVEDHPVYRGERVETLLEWDGDRLIIYWVGEDRGYIAGYEVLNTREVLEKAKGVCRR